MSEQLQALIQPIIDETQLRWDGVADLESGPTLGKSIAQLMVNVNRDQNLYLSLMDRFMGPTDNPSSLSDFLQIIRPGWQPKEWAEMVAILPLIELGYALTGSSDQLMSLTVDWCQLVLTQMHQWDMNSIRSNLDQEIKVSLHSVMQLLGE